MNVRWKTVAVLSVLGIAQAAWGQSYPAKPVRMVVGFPAGGPIDIVARVMSPKLSEVFGQQVIIDNRGGANGLIGGEAVAKSAPDGYTMMLISTGTATISPHIYPKMPYDAQRDLVCVTLVTQTGELLVVHPSLPVKSVKELIALAKTRPGEISIASTGSGGLPHLALELFKIEGKVNMLHVPFNGAAPAVSNAVGGQVQGVIADLPVLQPHIQSGRLRALALTSPKRTQAMPDVMTFAEAGYAAIDAVTINGILAPANTPKDYVQRVNRVVNGALKKPEMQSKLIDLGFEVAGGTPEEFATWIRTEIVKWAKVVKDSGARAEGL